MQNSVCYTLYVKQERAAQVLSHLHGPDHQERLGFPMAKRKTTTAPAIPQDGKHIRYDRETGDYACYLNGQLIGYAPNYSDGELLCDQTNYELLTHAGALPITNSNHIFHAA